MNELERLYVAIRKNLARPTSEEKAEIKVDRKLAASPSLEGDTQVGMVLFIGIADSLLLDKDLVKDFLSIEFEDEYKNKLNRYNSKAKKNERFQNKIKLVLNHYNTQDYKKKS